jgi:hypothetical protein
MKRKFCRRMQIELSLQQIPVHFLSLTFRRVKSTFYCYLSLNGGNFFELFFSSSKTVRMLTSTPTVVEIREYDSVRRFCGLFLAMKAEIFFFVLVRISAFGVLFVGRLETFCVKLEGVNTRGKKRKND